MLELILDSERRNEYINFTVKCVFFCVRRHFSSRINGPIIDFDGGIW